MLPVDDNAGFREEYNKIGVQKQWKSQKKQKKDENGRRGRFFGCFLLHFYVFINLFIYSEL